jgi:tryptophan-rich sensory protein
MAHTVWTVVFFGLHALLLSVLLVLVIGGLAVETWRRFAAIDRRAAWLLTPYLAWVAYTLWLSAGFWWLNEG